MLRFYVVTRAEQPLRSRTYPETCPPAVARLLEVGVADDRIARYTFSVLWLVSFMARHACTPAGTGPSFPEPGAPAASVGPLEMREHESVLTDALPDDLPLRFCQSET